MEELKTGEKEICFDDCMFAPQVDYRSFKDNKSLSFSAENGEKLIMTYKTSIKKQQLPIILNIRVLTQTKYTFKIEIDVHFNFNSKFHCN